MDTGEQEPGPRSIALPLAMAAVAILLLGWALVASQGPAEAQVETTSTPPAGDGIDGPTGQVAPQRPTGLTGQGGNRQISLDWSTVAGATGYEVQQWDGRSNNGSGSWRTLPFTETGVGSYTVAFSGSSAVVSGLADSIGYFHRVRTVQGSESSSWTAYVLTYTLAATTATPTHTPTPTLTATSTPTPTATSTPVPLPGPPTNLHISVHSSDQNRIVVDYVASGPPHSYYFELHRASTRGGNYSNVKNTGVGEASPPADFLNNSLGYWYKARGRNCLDYARTQCGAWSPFTSPMELTSTTQPTTATPTPTGTATPTATHTATATATPPNVRAEIEDEDGREPSRLPDDREWFEFELDSSHPILVYLNRHTPPGWAVGSKTEQSGTASCSTAPGASGQAESSNFSLRDGDEFYLAGCTQGTTTVELMWESPSNEYIVIRTYNVEVVDDDDYYDPDPTATRTPTPTPTATPTPTHTPTGPVNTPTHTPTQCPTGTPHTTKKHQADHTIKYQLGSVPTAASAPATPFGTPGTPTPVPANFRNAISKAVEVWNPLVATPGPQVVFCTSTNGLCSGTNDRNMDGYIITVKVVAGNSENIGNPQYYSDCGSAAACVKPTDPGAYGDDDETIHNIFGGDAPVHLENITLVIEEPAYEVSEDSINPITRVYWTNKKALVGISNPINGKVWRYLPSTVMHELGHAAGLLHPPDAQLYSYSGLMGFPGDDEAPSTTDVNKMQTLYSGHCPHTPTPTN